MKRAYTKLTVALCASLLSACASSYGLAPSAKSLDASTLEMERTTAEATLSSGWPAADWWKRLGDAQLDSLIEEALAGSPSMGIAKARLAQATAYVTQAGAARWPQLSGTFDTTRQRFSENGIFPPPIGGSTFTQSQLALDFGYEFDIWGKNRAAYEAALGEAKAAEVDAFAARLLLSTSVAHAYVRLQRAFDQLDVANETLKQREDIFDLTRKRVEAGIDSHVELKQSEAAVPIARERVAQFEEEVALARNALAALLGKGPDRGLAIERPRAQFDAQLGLPSRLPADLIGRRPDIVAQRWRVEAARHQIDSTKAEFYPNIDLTALFGFQSVDLGKLLLPGSRIPTYGAAIHLPLFDGGRLRGSLAAQDAAYDLAVEQYNQSVVDALRDVVDQLASLRSLATQRAQLEQALAAAEEAYGLAMKRYDAGVGNYLQVLSVEAAVLDQRGLAADLHSRELDLSINLIRALGGGFEDTAVARASLTTKGTSP